MAASRLPILDAAPSLDDLPPLPAENLEIVPLGRLIDELIARAPIEAAAHRFARNPGPAERAQFVAKILNPQPEA